MNMPEPELPSRLLVDAAKALCQSRSVPFMIRQKGDRDRGTILVSVLDMRGQAQIWRQQRNLEFVLCWRVFPEAGCMSETEAEQEIQKALSGDPDQWIVELEDREMRFPFEGPRYADANNL